MRVDRIRSSGKKILKERPRLYSLGQWFFLNIKEAGDRFFFRYRYPSVSYVRFRKPALTAMRAKKFHSQYGQDYYLWTTVFHGKAAGVYVDIGGNDPVELSNSYYLEQQGWQGMAFDPLARAARLWSRHRTATFHHAAISDTAETRDFVEIEIRDGWEHTLSGFKEFVREEDKQRFGFREYPVRAAPLTDFASEDTHIDIIMIDVEGAEEVVLRGIDLERLQPDYLMIENVSELGGGQAVRGHAAAHGYDLIARIGAADDLFKRRGLSIAQ